MIIIRGSMFADEPTRTETCPDCSGKGRVWLDVRHPASGEYVNVNRTCGLCRGTGKITYTRK